MDFELGSALVYAFEVRPPGSSRLPPPRTIRVHPADGAGLWPQDAADVAAIMVQAMFRGWQARVQHKKELQQNEINNKAAAESDDILANLWNKAKFATGCAPQACSPGHRCIWPGSLASDPRAGTERRRSSRNRSGTSQPG